MKFTNKSGLAKIWFNEVKDDPNAIEKVPNILNLRDVIKSMIEEYERKEE